MQRTPPAHLGTPVAAGVPGPRAAGGDGILYVPEQPPSESAQQYRGAAYEIPCFELVSGSLTIRLLDDPNRAEFTFECLVEPTRETAASEDEFATQEWVYDIPALPDEVSGARAWDAAGTLQTQLHPPESRATRLRVRFRHLLRDDTQSRFWFAYEAPVRSVVSTGMLSRTVVCTGWFIFNLPCRSMRVCIHLPSRARLTKSAPPAEVATGEAAPQVHFHLERLRPLESSQWLVAYERRRIGLPVYLWTMGQLAAGAAGWLIGRALDGWTARP